MKNPWIQYPTRVMLAFLGVIGVYLLLAAALSPLRTRPEARACEQKAPFYVATTGIHLEIVLPREQLPLALEHALGLPDQARYVALGWGERDFYLTTPAWSDLKPGLALKAVLIPTPSALHLTTYTRRSSDWYQLNICPESYEDLNAYLLDSFAKDPEGRPRRIDHPGYNDRDAFYEANRRYSFYRTCNNWVNQALQEADVQTAVWSPFEFGLLYHLPEKGSPRLDER